MHIFYPGKASCATFVSGLPLLIRASLPFTVALFFSTRTTFSRKKGRVFDRVRDGWSEMRGADTILLSLFFRPGVCCCNTKQAHTHRSPGSCGVGGGGKGGRIKTAARGFFKVSLGVFGSFFIESAESLPFSHENLTFPIF